MNNTQLLEKLIAGRDLSSRDTRLLFLSISEKNMSAATIAAILIALRIKGETSDEIIGFLQAMREKMIRITANSAVDVCGTGGDNSDSFNISTAVSLVAAGAGAVVVKHGNRKASSLCGSADVLEALGVNIQLTPTEAQKILKEVGIVFLFAPLYHPAMSHVAQVRKELGVRTVFNILGPFTNPASVRRQIIGTPDITTAKKLAYAAQKLSYIHLCIVTCDGMDEAGMSGPTNVFEIKKQSLKTFSLNPTSFGFTRSSKKDIRGGDAKTNAHIIQRILEGEKGPCRDIVVFNSAIALYVAGVAYDIRDGITKAINSIDSGLAKTVLTKLIEKTRAYE